MNNENDSTLIGVCFIIAILGSSFFGAVSGIGIGKNSATRETVKTCVEKPQECKTMYDFYKLDGTK